MSAGLRETQKRTAAVSLVKLPKVFGKDIPCGCESREQIMGAGDWQTDAVVVGIVILLAVCVVGQKGLT